MVYLLFHTNLKFYLPVLKVNRTFTDCTESAECTQCVGNPSPHQLYSFKKTFVTAHNLKIFAKNQCLVAACTRNTVGTHSVQSVHWSRYSQKQLVL